MLRAPEITIFRRSERAELSQATAGHFAILSKSQMSQLEHNTELIKELEAPKLAAQEKRGKARLELSRHEATHPKANGVAMSTARGCTN
jgi:hypothetical protein